MNRFLKFVMITLFAVAGGSAAHAVCDEQRTAFYERNGALLVNFRERQRTCDEFRLCKAEARSGKRECKHEARNERFSCLQDCKALKGAAKRQCKRECRQDKRNAAADCRNLKRAENIDCRDNNEECMELQDKAWELIPAAAAASDAYYSCLRENAEEAAKDPETQEDAQDAEEAANSDG